MAVCRSAAPVWRGATREHTGSIRPRSNAARTGWPPPYMDSLDALFALERFGIRPGLDTIRLLPEAANMHIFDRDSGRNVSLRAQG